MGYAQPSAQPNPITIFCDNQLCITLSKDPKFHEKSKHIEIQYHYLREKVKSKSIILIYCSTNMMLVDILALNMNIVA